jgi:hypothetical protein
LEKPEGWMALPEFEFDDSESKAEDAAGSPEGDGDFETDNLPDTGVTSAGGQLSPKRDSRDGLEGRAEHHEPEGLMKVIDEISTGKIQP